jgi:phosphohistidine phosphatase
MELYFLRHAIAADREDWTGRDDAARPLTPEGSKRMEKAARGMKRLGLRFDRIASSPLTRALQTAKIVADALGHKGLFDRSAPLGPGAGFPELLKFLGGLGPREKVLLVGHEPGLSGFVSQFLAERGRLALEFKKGGLLRVDFSETPRAGQGTLKWFLAPKHLRLVKETAEAGGNA